MFGSLKKLFGGQEAAKHEILAPVAGKAIPMSEVADPTFSQEILGKGVAVVIFCCFPVDGSNLDPF